MEYNMEVPLSVRGPCGKPTVIDKDLLTVSKDGE